ncbi:Glycosyl transferase family 2 [Carbonactinospora thermoautotrophica]|uniref:Glycosyl transferase family 2 n=1 Tax=Carbonactinospora thermoautotrophica TaxID=1469144 RepID=A0A132MMD4_9ACTN|nr:glycosyltransferase family 2 protein [Carbonactinospora thermoautotrophica]KWW98581.1 Glycosyl transferase family 2 [Carbonactinospora thermoautotrophica]
MTDTLRAALRARSNAHAPTVAGFEALTGHAWHQPTPARLAAGRAVSVVIPARNVAYCLAHVLDALAKQDTEGPVEMIVVDDASTDATADIAAAHPAVDILVRLPHPMGAAVARNLGTRLASADTVVYVDADMVLPPHVLADFAARAADNLVLVGFRHNVPFTPGSDGMAAVPAGNPQLAADHRVTWRPPVGTRLLYSGIVLDKPLEGRPLDHTRDFQDLGYGAWYYDWDLPRMVVTALLAAPRAAVLDVGGFDAEFGRIGWGMEDTHLGAALIASGCLVVPLRQAVGFHLDPPDAEQQWQRKLATWPATVAHYQRRLNEPVPIGRTEAFTTVADRLLAQAEVSTR